MTPGRFRLSTLAVGLLVAGWLGASSLATTPNSPVDPAAVEECDAAVEQAPEELDSWACYFEAARRRGLWLPAIGRLEDHLREDPDNFGARLTLGSIQAYRPGETAEATIREAAEGYDRLGDVEGSFRARSALLELLESRGRFDEAAVEFERMRSISEEHPYVNWRVLVLRKQADRALRNGQVARARELLSEALELGPPPDSRPHLENALGRVAWAEGRLPDARERFRLAAEGFRALGDHWSEASELHNESLAASRGISAGKISLEEVVAMVEHQIDVSAMSGNESAASQGLLSLAQYPTIPIETRVEYASRALATLRSTQQFRATCFALRLSANLLLLQDRSANLDVAERLLDEAAALARARGVLEDEARSLIVRANLSSSHSNAEFREPYEQAIEVVERMRDLRPDRLSRGRYLWDWVHVYQRLVGSLLTDDEDGLPDDSEIDRAFRTMERLRARMTLDVLDGAGATERQGAGGSPVYPEREKTLASIAAIQRDLSRPGLSETEAERMSGELARLEILEASQRETIAREDAWFARLRSPEPVGVAAIQDRLGPDEAMIAFQLSTREVDGRTKWSWNGGSWAIVITRESARPYPLPDRDLIAEGVSIHRGLLLGDHPREPEAAARLFEDLLATPLGQIPDPVRRLILIPDGALHRLPFDALREAQFAPPLGARFAISIVPSGTLWARQRDRPDRLARGVLAMADPFPTVGAESDAETRGDRESFGRLPHAREEATQVAQAIGQPSRVLLGRAASERALKRALPGPGSLVHLAAHAVVDDGNPARTAILLAPGGGAEDGLLQLREIVSLPLDGRVVWLSACSGAGGELAAGEGVVGLARGFFQAGARSVVAGLWPVRDRNARDLLTAVGRAWSAGATLDEAMAEARREAIAAGRPASEWAGWIVLGDGGVRLQGEPRAAALSTRGGFVGIATFAGLVVALGFGLLIRFR